MAEGKTSWGVILAGAALVTGIAAAAVFWAAPMLAALAGATAVTGGATLASGAGEILSDAGGDLVSEHAAAASVQMAGDALGDSAGVVGIASNIGTAILQAVGKAAAWMTESTAHKAITVATGTVVGAATGALASKATGIGQERA